MFIVQKYNVNLFWAFIFNNEEERAKNKARETTSFAWTYLLNNKEKCENPLYDKKNCKKE